MKKVYLVLTVISFLAACSTPKLTNSHSGKYKVSNEKLNDLFTLDVNIVPLPPPAAKEKKEPITFFNLNDSTQVHYLNILAKKVNKAEDFIAFLKKPLSNPTSNSNKPPTSYDKIKVKFYINHIKQYHKAKIGNDRGPIENLIHPNSRIAWLNTTINLSGSPLWKIESIDKVQTLYETIDLGSLSRDQNTSFNISGSAGYDVGNNLENVFNQGSSSNRILQNSNLVNLYDDQGNLIGSTTAGDSTNSSRSRGNTDTISRSRLLGTKAEASYGNTTAIKEAYNLKFNEIKTGYSFNDSMIKISQKGSFSRDISNVETVTATLRYDKPVSLHVHTFSKLFKMTKTSPEDKEPIGPNKADKIQINRRQVKYIPCNQNEMIKMIYSYDGLFRSVENKVGRGKNMLEYDDKVIYYSFSSDDSDSVGGNKIVSTSEYCKPFYRIRVKFKSEDGYRTLQNNKTGEDILILWEEDPFELKRWIEAVKNRKASFFNTFNYELKFNEIVKDGGEINFIGPSVTINDISKINSIEDIRLDTFND